MSLDAKPHPRCGVTLGLIAATLNILEDRVVVLGIAAEIFLDRDELWCKQPSTGEHQRLNDARDAAVAIAEWMHGDQMQMGHGGAHGHVCGEVLTAEPGDDLAHQPRHLLTGRPDVCRLAPSRSGDLDAVPTIATVVLVLLEVA